LTIPKTLTSLPQPAPKTANARPASVAQVSTSSAVSPGVFGVHRNQEVHSPSGPGQLAASITLCTRRCQPRCFAAAR
jgi:hypothetical protein